MVEKGRNENSKSNELAQESLETGHLPTSARKRYVIALVVIAASAPSGNILLKLGLGDIGKTSIASISDIFPLVAQALTSPWLDAGIMLLIVQFLALTYALRFGPLSLTVPLRGAATYAGTTALAVFFLGEKVSLLHWGAILVILLGMMLIGLSGRKHG